jgi:hypothetical protein
MRALLLAGLALIALHGTALSEWSIESIKDRAGRETTRALLHEPGGRATLVIQCAQHGPEPVLFLHEPVSVDHLQLTWRFDDDQAQTRMAPVSSSGHVVTIWSEVEKQAFARSQLLRIQLRPFVVFSFDLGGIGTLAAKLKC